MPKERFDPSAPKPLDKVPVSLWAEVWCSLSRLEWHEALGEKPVGWDDCITVKDMKEIRCAAADPIIQWIEFEIGTKGCLRHMKMTDGMTDQQFEDWWDSQIFEKYRKTAKSGHPNSMLSIILCGMCGAAFAMLVKFLIGLTIG